MEKGLSSVDLDFIIEYLTDSIKLSGSEQKSVAFDPENSKETNGAQSLLYAHHYLLGIINREPSLDDLEQKYIFSLIAPFAYREWRRASVVKSNSQKSIPYDNMISISKEYMNKLLIKIHDFELIRSET